MSSSDSIIYYRKQERAKDARKALKQNSGGTIMDKRTIIRICIAVLWVVIGIIELVKKETTMGIISIFVGAAFAFDAFRTMKKK